MTIEIRVSFPEGGTECSPDRTYPTVPTSPSSTCGPSPSVTEASESSSSSATRHPNRKNITLLNSDRKEAEFKDDSCSRNCEDDNDSESNKFIMDGGKQTTETVQPYTKLSPKLHVKSVSQVTGAMDGRNREEMVARKSMRLRMRMRGKTDNSNDLLGSKGRPRYVEDLTEINFNDSQCKVMFLDVLGLTPSPKDHSLPSSLKAQITQNGGTHEPSEPVPASENLVEPITDVVDDKSDTVSVVNAIPESTGIDSDSTTETTCNITDLDNVISEESRYSDGWQCWIDKLSANKAPSVAPSPTPTQKEIDGCLSKLAELGTSVRVILCKESSLK